MKFKLCTGDKMFEVSFIVTEKNNKWSLVDWEEKRQRFGMCVVRRRFNCQILLENETINQVQEKELVFDDDPLTWGAVADATRASESFTYTIWQIRPKKTASTASYNLGVS